MSKAQRTKGQRGERELAELLSEYSGIPVARLLGQERDGGGDMFLWDWVIECKRSETRSLGRWWVQAEKAAQHTSRRPAVAYRASREPWRVVVELSVPEFVRIVGVLLDRRVSSVDEAKREDG